MKGMIFPQEVILKTMVAILAIIVGGIIVFGIPGKTWTSIIPVGRNSWGDYPGIPYPYGTCEDVSRYTDEYRNYAPAISAAVQKYNLWAYVSHPEALVAAIITHESGWDPKAKSHAQPPAIGLMQVVPEKHPECPYTIRTDTTENIDCGVRILADYYNKYKDGKSESWISNHCSIESYQRQYASYRGIEATLRAYNGWGCTRDADTDYVETIMSLYSAWRDCLTGGVAKVPSDQPSPLPLTDLKASDICRDPATIPAGEDNEKDEVVVILGPYGCWQNNVITKNGRSSDPYCNKLYYCLDGKLVNLNFDYDRDTPNKGNYWAHIGGGKPGDLTPVGHYEINFLRRCIDCEGLGTTPSEIYNKCKYALGYESKTSKWETSQLPSATAHGYHCYAYNGGAYFYKNYYIHGLATHPDWIGKREEGHGCVEMDNSDMGKLYPHLDLGDPVSIYSEYTGEAIAKL